MKVLIGLFGYSHLGHVLDLALLFFSNEFKSFHRMIYTLYIYSGELIVPTYDRKATDYVAESLF
jgi:hypothetical protein